MLLSYKKLIDPYLRCKVEVIERNEVSLEEAGQETEINPVRELALKLSNLQVDLVEVLVHKSDQALLNHLQYESYARC